MRTLEPPEPWNAVTVRSISSLWTGHLCSYGFPRPAVVCEATSNRVPCTPAHVKQEGRAPRPELSYSGHPGACIHPSGCRQRSRGSGRDTWRQCKASAYVLLGAHWTSSRSQAGTPGQDVKLPPTGSTAPAPGNPQCCSFTWGTQPHPGSLGSSPYFWALSTPTKHLRAAPQLVFD